MSMARRCGFGETSKATRAFTVRGDCASCNTWRMREKITRSEKEEAR